MTSNLPFVSGALKLPENAIAVEPMESMELTLEELELVAGGLVATGTLCGCCGKRCPVGYWCYSGGVCSVAP